MSIGEQALVVVAGFGKIRSVHLGVKNVMARQIKQRQNTLRTYDYSGVLHSLRLPLFLMHVLVIDKAVARVLVLVLQNFRDPYSHIYVRI